MQPSPVFSMIMSTLLVAGGMLEKRRGGGSSASLPSATSLPMVLALPHSTMPTWESMITEADFTALQSRRRHTPARKSEMVTRSPESLVEISG